MFKLSLEEQKQARASKPIQTLDEITTYLGMDELVAPTTLVDIQNAIRETFGYWACKVNPESESEKVYAYNAMRILQEVSRTRARLYIVVADSRDKELRFSSDLWAQLVQMEKIHEVQRTKLQVKFFHFAGPALAAAERDLEPWSIHCRPGSEKRGPLYPAH